MNKRQAKAYVLRRLAVEALSHVDNGSAWVSGPGTGSGIKTDEHGCFLPSDQRRIVDAVLEIADEMERRSKGR